MYGKQWTSPELSCIKDGLNLIKKGRSRYFAIQYVQDALRANDFDRTFESVRQKLKQELHLKKPR